MSSPRLTFRDLSSSSSKKRKASENTPSKRQRFKSLFADEIVDVDLPKKIDAVRQCFGQLGGNCVSDNDLLSSLVISYGFKSVTRFLGALNHVPDSFVDRNLYVSRIVNVESEVIPFDQISKYSEHLKSFVEENKFELAADILWKCTDSYGEGYLAFLVPPVMQCLECGEQLYTCNKVGITLFTLKGPLPGLKVTKRCKKGCGALYNIDRYSVPGVGTTFYKNYKTCIAASNCVYVEKDVHELLCQSATGSFALGDVYKPKDFATALNRTTPDGGNLLMLNNTELGLLVKSLIRELKDREPQYRRELVKIAGRQEDSNIIVINPKEVVHIDAGVVGPIDHTSYVWFGKSSPRPEMERHFAVPTDVQPLRTFLDLGLKVLGPEVFGVAMLAWSAMYGLNMYSWIIQHLRHFNLPLMFGEPMVGKSLIASCAAWLNGCPNTAIASRCTLSYVTAQVTNSTMPFVWDDPTTAEEVAQLAVDLGNGAVRGKTTDGETRVPKTGCLVTANFNMTDMLKYFSRIVLMIVPKSDKRKEVGQAVQLENSAHKASSAFPLVMREMHNIDIADVHCEYRRIANLINTEPRIVEGIALNILITRKVLNLAGRYNYMEHVLEYVTSHMIPYYQSQLPMLGLPHLPNTEGQLPAATNRSIGEAINFKEINRDNAVFVKKGKFLAVDNCVVKQRALLPCFGCVLNRPTRLRGKARKLIHIPCQELGQSDKEELMRKLGDHETVEEPHLLLEVPREADPLQEDEHEHDIQPQTAQEPIPNTLHEPEDQNEPQPCQSQPVKKRKLGDHETVDEPHLLLEVPREADPLQEHDTQPHTAQEPIPNTPPEPEEQIEQQPCKSQPVKKPRLVADPIQIPTSEPAPIPQPFNEIQSTPLLVSNPAKNRQSPNKAPAKPQKSHTSKDREPKTTSSAHLKILSVQEKIKDVCRKCAKEGRRGQCWVACDQCGTWFHKTCTGMPQSVYKQLKAGTRDWFCSACKGKRLK